MAFVCACSDATVDDPNRQPSPEELFSSDIARVELEVDYEDGAAPITGAAGKESDAWNVTEQNLDALFGGDKTLVVPHALDEMHALGSLGGGPYDTDELLAIAETYRDRWSSQDTATFYVVFVDGLYEEDGEVDDSVIGIHLGGTGVIAMFAPAIGDEGKLTAFVEQSTLVHEVGHAAGLVNSGLPLTADHHDAAHGAHCTLESCVMYYALEGKKSVVDFVKAHVKEGEPLFGPDCLADAATARR